MPKYGPGIINIVVAREHAARSSAYQNHSATEAIHERVKNKTEIDAVIEGTAAASCASVFFRNIGFDGSAALFRTVGLAVTPCFLSSSRRFFCFARIF